MAQTIKPLQKHSVLSFSRLELSIFKQVSVLAIMYTSIKILCLSFCLFATDKRQNG